MADNDQLLHNLPEIVVDLQELQRRETRSDALWEWESLPEQK